jgi:23S rRNA (guanosine2251-2'-O)-methyltransferase
MQKAPRDIVVVAHDMRSTHNVGSLLRTAEGLGVSHVYLTGYTPYPVMSRDSRLPHIAQRLNKQIHKTALDAELLVPWSVSEDVYSCLNDLKTAGFQVAALEQTSSSIALPIFKPKNKIAILLGREVEGIEPVIIDFCDLALEIPMFGNKESFNVVQAAAMVLYHCRFATF